jgi:subtilisin family serine protease
MTAAINTLWANGVTSFASSGNGCDKNAMSIPACISKVLSTGAVYDANIGPFTWPGVCTDATTAADKVACWSNSDSTLDLLAPGCATTSTGLAGGQSIYCGTSQASPHAAGCAALMLSANPALTPATIETRLEATGVPVTDPGPPARITPRIDCYAAIFPGVGGVQDLPDVAGNTDSGGSSLPYAAVAGAAMGLVVIGAGGWYARRRWLS